MRGGATIKPGSSVVLSVPASVFQRSQATGSGAGPDALGFRTDGYFNVLEQYIERALIAVGLQAKDRSKFEAKLRDLRDTGTGPVAARRTDDAYLMVLANLQRELDDGKISREEFTDEAKQLRDKLLDPSRGSRNREEMTDISEVIRAAQDGEVMADYVLQVNDLAANPYDGVPIQLGTCREVQAALRQNPGLRIEDGNSHDSLPSTLQQPWWQARFNAKLIDVKTGTIDWIGEYTIESLSVLEQGVHITIGVRRQTTNGKAIVDAIVGYNRRLQGAYQHAVDAGARLDNVYRDAMQSIRSEGTSEQGDAIENRRRAAVHQGEREFAQALSAYHATAAQQPPEARLDWTYGYDVDAPTAVPDLLNPNPTNQLERERQLAHVKALGFKVTHDLLRTVKVTEK